MTNVLLRDLRARAVVLDAVLPFVRRDLAASMAARHPEHVVMQIPESVRPGRYWLVSKADAERMKAAGYDPLPPSGGNSGNVSP